MKANRKIKTSSNLQPSLNLNMFFGAESIERAAELYEQMERPILKATDLEIEIRLLGHWVKLLTEKSESDTRKRYSFTEYVWFKTVEQLRNAGLSFPTILEL